MAAAAQDVEVISPKEALLRQQTGALANGDPAPPVAVVDTQAGPAPQAAPTQAANRPSYWDAPMGDQPPAANASAASASSDAPARPSYWDVDVGADNTPKPPPPKPAPAPKPSIWRRALDAYTGAQGSIAHEAGEATKGLGGVMNETAGAVNTIAAPLVQSVEAWKDILTGKINTLEKLKGPAPTDWQDSWFRHTVDPTIEHAKDFATDESAPFADKASHAIGATLGYIAEAILTGGEGEAAPAVTEVKSGIEAAKDVAVQGAKMAQAPAVVQSVNVGREAYQSTGDPKLAFKLAAITYAGSVEQNMIPLAMPGKLATRMATGGGLQLAGGEASREAFNAAIPDDMTDADKRKLPDDELAAQNRREAAYADLRQPFSPEQAVLNVVQGAAMGGIAGPRAEMPNGMPHQAVERPQNIMEHAQVLAADEVKLQGGDLLDQTVAATHANAALGAHHDAAVFEGHHEIRMQQAAQEAEVQRQEEERAALEQAPGVAYSAREQELADQKDADFTAALNQRGDQEIERGNNLVEGFEKGGAEEPGPTLADSLSPEEMATFRTLAERRKAEFAASGGKKEELPPPTAEEKFTPYVPPKPKTLKARREAAQASADLGSPETEPLFNEKPPQTLQERRAGSGVEAPVEKTIAQPAPKAEDLSPESQRIAQKFAAEKDFNRNTEYQNLMLAKPGEHEALTAGMPIEEAQSHLDRLNAAPGENAPAKAALENRIKAGRAEVESAAHEAATSPKNDEPMPSIAEQNAGNFKMGRVEVGGLPISIEHPEGSTRPSGATMEGGHYGYVRGTVDADGMHTDVMVGKHPETDTAFIVDHLDHSGDFEQHKILMGFPNRLAAMRAYRSAFPENPLGPVSEVKTGELKDWLANGDTTRPYDQRGVNRLADTRSRFASTTEPAKPEDMVHTRNADGTHTVQTPGDGKTEAIERENGNLQIKSTETAPGLRGAGNGTARVERLAQEAHARGGKLESDNRVSAPAQAVYERLKAKGYDIKENPSRVDPGSGEKISASELKPVYEVGPKTTQARDTAPGERPANSLTKDQVTEALKPLTDRIGSESMQVHDDASTLPAHIQADMAAYNHPEPRAVFDPNSGQVHIVAGAHESADHAMRTAVHEIVGHKGLRALLGNDFSGTMADVYRNVGAQAKAWMRDYAEQHGLDLRNARHQGWAADEYAAHLAEYTDENPGILRQVMDSIRAGLRKLGLVREWNDDDIRALLRKSASNLESEHARAAAAAKGDGPRFADKEDTYTERFAPDHPLAQAHKFGKTMEEQANYNPGVVRSRGDWLKEAGVDAKSWVKDKALNTLVDQRLAFIGLRNLPDFMNPKLMPSLRQFVRLHDQLTGRANEMINKATDVARDWSSYVSKDKVRGAALGDLMHASTIGGVDPSKPYVARFSDEVKAADPAKAAHDAMGQDLHRQLKEIYNKQLDDKGRELYNTVRDHYKQTRIDTYKALEQRIAESGAESSTKKALIAELRQKFEANRVQGPYFPLARFGDFWASAKDADGKTVSFSRFESKANQTDWILAMKERGYAIDGGQRMDDRSVAARVDPAFAGKVAEMAKDVDPKLADEIWQEYLRALPEMSVRKQFIHRQGRLGYSMDALRAFSSNSFHSANQTARLEYGHRLESTLDDMKSEAQSVMSDAIAHPDDDLKQKNAAWAPALAREMDKRNEWIKNPKGAAWASALTKAGFAWYLGAAPATAFRILSQNPMLAQPVLAGYHGQLGATRELARASYQWATAKGSLGDKLRGDERDAFDQAARTGVFSNNNTQMLLSGGKGGPVGNGTMHEVGKALGFMFNAMENHNRMTTFVAGYRLGRTQGMSHTDAIEHAADMTWSAHFDYNSENRPRVLQNDVIKVAALFKQYSWGVTYRLAREARNMFDAELSPPDRTVAKKTFAGLLGRCFMFAGATGLPLAWLANSVASAILGTKDRPVDAEAEAHAYLAQHIGQTAADAVMTGPVGAISGASLSGGASYSDLWYRSPSRDEDPADTTKDAIVQATGAIPSAVVNGAEGWGMVKDGQIERGVEHMVPPELAALMKTYRYSQEGAKNLQGEDVMSRDEISNKDLFLQSVGFTPQALADRFAENNALKNITKEIQQRRADIMNRLAVAVGVDDETETKRAYAEIDEFNKENPKYPIDYRSIHESMHNKLKDAAEAVNGVRLPRGLADLRDSYSAQPQAAEAP
jgi:hypothetical protein